VKKACEPIHVQWNCSNNRVKIINNTLQDRTNLKAKATVYNLDGSIYGSLSKEKTVNVLSNSVQDCFLLTGNTASLTSLDFIRLELRDDADRLLSENFYWRNVKDADDYTALNSLPKADLIASSATKCERGEYCIDYTITNQSTTVAFGIRLRVVNARTGKRILPVFMSDNYFTLMPGESKQISVTFDESLVGSDEVVILSKQYGFAEEKNPGENVISNPESSSFLQIYPNPASDAVYINTNNEAISIQIFDVNGKIVYRSENESIVRLSHLSKGFYLLKMRVGNETEMQKLIKQ
jgi:hypothetical protein